MWVMLPAGFVSVVEKASDRGNGTLTVRSRDKQSLVEFCRLAQTSEKVTEGGGTDYPYRVVMARADIQYAMVSALQGIDYSNFKTRVGKVRGGVYERFLHKVWVAGLGLTPWQTADRLDLPYRPDDFV